MARPAPDPERVVEVYELALKYPYRRVVEIMAERGRPVSLGTVSEWTKTGADWWRQVEQLDHAGEYGLHRQFLGTMMEWLHDAHDDGDMTTAEAIGFGLKILDRHARLTGVDAPARVAVKDDRDPAEIPTPGPAAVRAIESMKDRARRREREVIEGDHEQDAS